MHYTRNTNMFDVFITNRSSLVNKCCTLPGISNNDIMMVDSDKQAKRRPKMKRKIYLWKRADVDVIGVFWM